MVPNAQGAQGARRLLGGYGGNDWRTQWEREQWLLEQQRQRDELERDRLERERERNWDHTGRGDDTPSRGSAFRTDNGPIPNANWIPSATVGALRGGGNLVSLQSSQLVVKIDGDVVRVQHNGDSKIEVLGAADVDTLTPGRIVRIEGSFESKGEKLMQATGPIGAVEIITPHAGSIPGTITELAGAAAPINRQNQAPAANMVRSLSVIGRVMHYDHRDLTLDLAGTTLKAALDPNATVSLRGSDINMAHAGDRVDVVGYYLKPGYAMGKEITITLAKPLGNPINGFNKPKAAIPAANAAVPVVARPAGE